MMRKQEIAATSVDIDRLPQETLRQGGALDMPAGPSWTPGALPGRLTSGLGLPEDEVERVTLTGIIRVVPPFIGDGQHLLPRKTAEFPVRRPRVEVEVDAAACLVGYPDLTELAHRGDDLGKGLCGARKMVRSDGCSASASPAQSASSSDHPRRDSLPRLSWPRVGWHRRRR